MDGDLPLRCPSAAAGWDDARLLGVVEGTAEEPRLTYLPPLPVTEELLALVPPELAPEEVFRFTGACRGECCPQFVGGACAVAKAAVDHLDVSPAHSLPDCGIRPHCRWWSQEGPEACRRCDRVVTSDTARAGTAYAEALPYKPQATPAAPAASRSLP